MEGEIQHVESRMEVGVQRYLSKPNPHGAVEVIHHGLHRLSLGG
jgi:hypothetical protein